MVGAETALSLALSDGVAVTCRLTAFSARSIRVSAP